MATNDNSASIAAKVPETLKKRLQGTAAKEHMDESKLIRKTLDQHLPSLPQVRRYLP
ncbi:hypothetical protein PDESU_03342 [Pontiella desulfatans]|uniref:Ribbon-helix-helix protein CopG domain-containing protein n=1 Tax=Pontiella desulfatans TaxID=2750659 RepID=A0A6C2U4G2_PONDE|nr:hypothetical protein [Pontiella desulfatans]VGO14773.1 hypothetical protein PDESU_03342 [Pontiella desulfatans]